jgi:MerR family transcriptional regulator/heat shock protein HspR
MIGDKKPGRRGRRGAAEPRGAAAENAYVLIGSVAQRFGVHPQTLRLYEREGLIRPARSAGNTRLYDQETVERLEIILTLTRDLGVNLAGVEVILDLRTRLARMEGEVGRLMESVRAVAAEHAARAAGGAAPQPSNALALRPRGGSLVFIGRR